MVCVLISGNCLDKRALVGGRAAAKTIKAPTAEFCRVGNMAVGIAAAKRGLSWAAFAVVIAYTAFFSAWKDGLFKFNTAAGAGIC